MFARIARQALIASLSVVAVIATVAVTAAPASAAERLPEAEVGIADLDLATPAGVARLDRRIAAAAARLCGAADPRDFAASRQAEACRAFAVASAAPQAEMAAAALARRHGTVTVVASR